jgi:hypothetical protein
VPPHYCTAKFHELCWVGKKGRFTRFAESAGYEVTAAEISALREEGK